MQDETILEPQTKVFNIIYETTHIPVEGLISTVTPVSKPGKPPTSANCRPVAVLVPPPIVLSTILSRRLRSFEHTKDDQGAYRKDSNTTELIFFTLDMRELSSETETSVPRVGGPY